MSSKSATKSRLVLAVSFLAMGAGAPTVSGEQEFFASGAICQAITPNQARLLEWRTQGLVNVSSRAIWTLCPVPRTDTESELKVTLGLFNESSDLQEVGCFLRERKEGRQVNGVEGTVVLTPDSFSDEMFWEGGFMSDTHANIACLLPPGVLIESVKIESLDDDEDERDSESAEEEDDSLGGEEDMSESEDDIDSGDDSDSEDEASDEKDNDGTLDNDSKDPDDAEDDDSEEDSEESDDESEDDATDAEDADSEEDASDEDS